MIATALAAVCRLISGAAVEWRCDPNADVQRIYFGNHSSHLDAVALACALPVRQWHHAYATAAQDYFFHGVFRSFIAVVFMRWARF